MNSKFITVAEYLDAEGVEGTLYYYKGCLITESSPIDEKRTLLFMQLPMPIGGTYQEIVSNDTLVEGRY